VGYERPLQGPFVSHANLVYQFFVHTETIRKLPRPVEFVFNTPSHHRVFMPPDWQPGPDRGDRMALGLSERLKRTHVAGTGVAGRLG
jgi:hypothetical protein